MLILLCLAFFVMLLPDLPALLREKQWRELAVYLFLWVSGFVISALLTVGVKLPSPVKGIEHVIELFVH